MNEINYLQSLRHHFRPDKGWINDPNGLVYFKGYYHVFYQHCPNFETNGNEPVHWGHAVTKDFIEWEQLPIALHPDNTYDNFGCWSGTAIVKEDTLYLFYTSVHGKEYKQTVSVAYSTDGIHFEKYKNNPVIRDYPADGGHDFRDPAVCCIQGQYYCVMATGHAESKTGRLLLYKSEDLFNWAYVGIMKEWENCEYIECPSFVETENGMCFLTASVCPFNQNRYFSVMYGRFFENKFMVEHTAEIDKGPDQYAGQVFQDHKGRNIMISWMPGWAYNGYAEKDIGCMSIPRELRFEDGKISAYPIEEVRHLLKDDDECLERTESGFAVKRKNREPLIYHGEISELKILRDGYIAEIFINGGEKSYSVLL